MQNSTASSNPTSSIVTYLNIDERTNTISLMTTSHYSMEKQTKSNSFNLTSTKSPKTLITLKISMKPKQKYLEKQGFLQIYIESQGGKMKILSQIIDFNSLKEGENVYNQKFDKCPDKEAKIKYSVSYKFSQNLRVKNSKGLKNHASQKILMIESNYLPKQTLKVQESTDANKNSYIESNLFSNYQLDCLISKVEKKPLKSFYFSTEKRANSKSLQRNKHIMFNQSPQSHKKSFSKLEKKQFSSNKNLLNLKNNSYFINNQLLGESQILKTKISSLSDEVQMRTNFPQNNSRQISQLKISKRTLQRENKKLLSLNASLKSAKQRLQAKANQQKEKYQNTLTNHENQKNRWLVKQKQYQQNLKKLTQKVTILEFEKQRITFDFESFRVEMCKNEQKAKQNLENQKEAFLVQIRNLNQKINRFQQKVNLVQGRKNVLQFQNKTLIEKNLRIEDQIQQIKAQKYVIEDQILQKNIKIQRLNGKLLLFIQSIKAQKLVTIELESLKTQLNNKSEQNTNLKSLIASLKLENNEINKKLSLQKQENKKLSALIKHLESQKQQIVLDLNTQTQKLKALALSYKNIQTSFEKQKSIAQKYANDSLKSQFLLKEEIKTKEKQLQSQISQNRFLKQKIQNLENQLQEKHIQIKQLQNQLQSKQHIIDSIIQILLNFQQNLFNNHKFILITQNQTKKMSQNQRKNKDKLLFESNNLKSKKVQITLRIKQIVLSFLEKFDKAIKIIKELDMKNTYLEKELKKLTLLIEKMHQQTVIQSNKLKGNNLILQEKLQANQNLISKLKLIEHQKDSQISILSNKLFMEQKTNNELRQNLSLLTIQLQSTKKNINNRIQEEQILNKKIKQLQLQLQSNKKNQELLKSTKSQEIEKIKKKYQQSVHQIKKITKLNEQLRQLLATNKIQTQKINNLFSEIYKQINNIQKESNLSIFLFSPLRDAVKKVQLYIFPKYQPTNFANLQTLKVITPRQQNISKSPSPLPKKIKSPQTKSQISSKDKISSLKSKESQKQ